MILIISLKQKIFVTLENVFSDFGLISCGVSQKSKTKTKTNFVLSNEKPTKTRHIIRRLLSKRPKSVEYLGCCHDYNLNGESIPRKVFS